VKSEEDHSKARSCHTSPLNEGKSFDKAQRAAIKAAVSRTHSKVCDGAFDKPQGTKARSALQD